MCKLVVQVAAHTKIIRLKHIQYITLNTERQVHTNESTLLFRHRGTGKESD